MFPEDTLSEFVLTELAGEFAGFAPPAPDPLPCDRWLARSCLQKAIRRGETALALRALANLLSYDPRSVWRHLTTIALEDVGVADMDLVACVVFAARSAVWRKAQGGAWRVAAYIAIKMAGAPHCQAACDLLLKATNCPSLDKARSRAWDADLPELIETLCDPKTGLQPAGIAALAIGGALDDGHRHREPATVFEVLSERGYSSHVTAVCHAGWKASRNPMALLLPLVWQCWIRERSGEERNDEMPPVAWIGSVPGYAVDQFTRTGGQVAKAYLKMDVRMNALFDQASIDAAQRPRALGDVVFLAEGGRVARRAIWKTGEVLRQPHRPLAHVIQLADRFAEIANRFEANHRLFENLRRQYLTPILST